jgi:hypothetical protein
MNTIKIWASYQGRGAEQVDLADSWHEARYLVGEYREAYGPGWSVWAGSRKGG